MTNKPLENTVVAAAIQLDTEIGNTEKNLTACERLAEEALSSGATWIGLPEFFNTGISWNPDLLNAIEYEDGPSANFLRNFSQKHSVVIGGSFLCRVPEGGVRNRYLCFSKGELIGKHDKDLPTMWENAFYEGSDDNDSGIVGEIEGIRVGSAVCWEFIRTQTARRMQGKVDVIIGGSHWWSPPSNWPKFLVEKAAIYNNDNLMKSVQETARLIGAPVIHASHCNTFKCKMLGFPLLTYHGALEGNTAIIDASGKILARRRKEEGEGVVIAKKDCQAQIIQQHTVKEDLQVIDIEIIGDREHRKKVLENIRDEVKYIHKKSFEHIPHSEMIPCVCAECRQNEEPYYFKYKVLEKFKRKGKSTIECQASADDVPISAIEEGVFGKKLNREQLDAYLQKGELEPIFDYVLQSVLYKNNKSNFILLSEQWYSNEQNRLVNLLDRQAYDQTRSRIINSVLQLLR